MSAEAAPAGPAGDAPLPDDGQRFQIELEFVQCLANPAYLQSLAQNRHLDDPDFVAFLRYLWGYWRRPEYARFLVYPHALGFLEMLVDDSDRAADFRAELKKPEFVTFVQQQQQWHWQYYHKNRFGGSAASSASAAASASAAGETGAGAGGEDGAEAGAEKVAGVEADLGAWLDA